MAWFARCAGSMSRFVSGHRMKTRLTTQVPAQVLGEGSSAKLELDAVGMLGVKSSLPYTFHLGGLSIAWFGLDRLH